VEARSTEEQRFEARLRALAPAIAALLRRRLGDGELRRDALQETLMRAWRARETYDAARPFGPWLGTIALRVASELERTNRRRRDGEPWREEDEAARSGPSPDDPGAELAHREELDRLGRAVAALAEVPRRIVLRFHRDGASVREVAEELAMPENTVKSHLRRARRLLARELGERP
jgi:RNA polymerase sigma-70 factor (ECF subfamily)